MLSEGVGLSPVDAGWEEAGKFNTFGICESETVPESALLSWPLPPEDPPWLFNGKVTGALSDAELPEVELPEVVAPPFVLASVPDVPLDPGGTTLTRLFSAMVTTWLCAAWEFCGLLVLLVNCSAPGPTVIATLAGV